MTASDIRNAPTRKLDIEREETTRLQFCLDRVAANLAITHTRLKEYQRDIQGAHDHMWEARRDLDHIDKAALRQSIDQMMRASDVLREQQVKLLKLRKSPYFARFDFCRPGEGHAQPFYIGVHDFRDEESADHLVFDWRAPISSLFYDYETGPAKYAAPSGVIEGDITGKRQFRIRNGKLVFLLESAVNIVDDVLQQELARSSDQGMKTIVATIQRDQNTIIRDADAHTLIIQGVAGSGKTSIALHRIAFLLYRFKDTLSADDMLIISPNQVFADYIGNVLPELGEQSVPEIGMDDLAAELLGNAIRFQTFFEQTALLLETEDEGVKARIRTKAAPELLGQLEAYAKHLEKSLFQPVNWSFRKRPVPGFVFEQNWRRLKHLPPGERRSETAKAVIEQVEQEYRLELRKEERADLRKTFASMVHRPTLRQAYKGFYDWIGQPDLLRLAGTKLEYADVFPIIYLKMLTEGVNNPWAEVQHLLVDEMQDYTPVQYAVLGRLFPCRKTILGDATQSVNPYSASSPRDIQRTFRGSSLVTLNKSYRSTYEIMQFALRIAPNPDLIAMRRHGDKPAVIACANRRAATRAITDEVADFQASEHRTLAVLAKTQPQAQRLQRQLGDAGVTARLLDPEQGGYGDGVLICTPHLAKGLEFDRVIVADASAANYATAMDRNLLYVACTRAMHRLSLIAVGAPSPFIGEADSNSSL